jgi:hypothetical protein
MAVAGALLAGCILNAERTDDIIAAAPERARRANWAKS